MEGALEDYVFQLKNCEPSNYACEDQADRFHKAKELTDDIRDIVKNSDKGNSHCLESLRIVSLSVVVPPFQTIKRPSFLYYLMKIMDYIYSCQS